MLRNDINKRIIFNNIPERIVHKQNKKQEFVWQTQADISLDEWFVIGSWRVFDIELNDFYYYLLHELELNLLLQQHWSESIHQPDWMNAMLNRIHTMWLLWLIGGGRFSAVHELFVCYSCIVLLITASLWMIMRCVVCDIECVYANVRTCPTQQYT